MLGSYSNIATIGHNESPEGIDAVIAALKAGEDVTGPLNAIEAAQDQEFDLETAAGRRDIASRAYAISKLKTEADNVGKSLVSEWKAKAKVVDATRATIRNRLDEIRDQVRQPLTDWETAEKTRKDDLVGRLCALNVTFVVLSEFDGREPSAKEAKAVLAKIEATVIDESWEEYASDAEIKKSETLKTLNALLDAAVKREAEQDELEELRAEKIRRDAAEQKRFEAENAKKLVEQKARDEAALLERIEREKEAAAKMAVEQAVKAAEIKAERERQEAAEREATLKRKVAEAEAREDQAFEAERKLIAAEHRAVQEELEKRKADKAHLERINAEISKAIAPFVEDYEVAVEITDAIFAGSIPHLEVRL